MVGMSSQVFVLKYFQVAKGLSGSLNSAVGKGASGYMLFTIKSAVRKGASGYMLFTIKSAVRKGASGRYMLLSTATSSAPPLRSH